MLSRDIKKLRNTISRHAGRIFPFDHWCGRSMLRHRQRKPWRRRWDTAANTVVHALALPSIDETFLATRRWTKYHEAIAQPWPDTLVYNVRSADHHIAIQWLVHWPLMSGLFYLVQRGGDWADRSPPRPLLAVPNRTVHPSTASVPTSYYSMWHYNCLWSLKG